MKGQSYVILSIILVIIIAVFAVTNVAPVEVNYLFWQVESPLILVILFSVLMGVLISGAVSMRKIYHLQKENRQIRSEHKQMQDVLRKNKLMNQVKLHEDTPQQKQKHK